MGLGQVRIESDRLLKRQNRLGVLVVAVQFLALFQQLAGAGAILRLNRWTLPRFQHYYSCFADRCACNRRPNTIKPHGAD